MSKPISDLKLALGADHAGFELKEFLKTYLQDLGATVTDCGTFSTDSTDYPDYGHKVAQAVENNQVDLGILVCGSGNGINMAANKHTGIRSALCWNAEVAALARMHNNANVIALPGRFVSTDEGKKIVDAFLSADFEGGRHQRRVDKIAC
jgi:ribose 5-phosphate isomerase B